MQGMIKHEEMLGEPLWLVAVRLAGPDQLQPLDICSCQCPKGIVAIIKALA